MAAGAPEGSKKTFFPEIVYPPPRLIYGEDFSSRGREPVLDHSDFWLLWFGIAGASLVTHRPWFGHFRTMAFLPLARAPLVTLERLTAIIQPRTFSTNASISIQEASENAEENLGCSVQAKSKFSSLGLRMRLLGARTRFPNSYLVL